MTALSCKIDYFAKPTFPLISAAWLIFTDDELQQLIAGDQNMPRSGAPSNIGQPILITASLVPSAATTSATGSNTDKTFAKIDTPVGSASPYDPITITGSVSGLTANDQLVVAITNGYDGPSDYGHVRGWMIDGGTSTEFGDAEAAHVTADRWLVGLLVGGPGLYNIYVWELQGTDLATAQLLSTSTITVGT